MTSLLFLNTMMNFTIKGKTTSNTFTVSPKTNINSMVFNKERATYTNRFFTYAQPSKAGKVMTGMSHLITK